MSLDAISPPAIGEPYPPGGRPRREGPLAWHLITGEYPPDLGGVSDYSSLVAGGLAGAGREVHVWCPPPAEGTAVPGVTVHRSAGSWSPRDFARVDRELDALPGPRRLLVQYTPNAYRRRGMNLGLGRWLLRRRRRGDTILVTFHEVRYHLQPGDGLARRFLGPVQNWIARDLLRAASHAFLTIPAWVDLLREISPGWMPPYSIVPVPSNIPVVDDPAGVAELRRRYAPGGEAIVGTFSTFGETVSAILAATLPEVLREPGRVGLLIGRESEGFAARLVAANPSLAGRVFATGTLTPAPLSRHLQAADLLIQVDGHGISGKSGTAMASLCHGRVIVAGRGPRTEPHWAEDRCVALAPGVEPAGLISLAEACLRDPAERARLSEAAASTYRRRYSIERTIAATLDAEAEAEALR